MAKIVAILGTLLLLLSLLLNIYFLKIKDSPKTYQVARVVDGDTFETSDGKTIRLLGVDAPELENCGGKEAKTALEKIISNKTITFNAPTVDAYNRAVADVYLPDHSSVNVLIIQSGWAAYDSSESTDKEKAKKAGEEIRLNKLGIYSPYCAQVTNTANPKCVVKGSVNDTRSSKIYYIDGCEKYKTMVVNLALGDKWFCSEKEAQDAGFVKSKKCSPNITPFIAPL